MGMFDTVVARCPACGANVEFQTKAGPCELKRYAHINVPADIAASLNGEVKTCSCGEVLRIQAAVPIVRVTMLVTKVSEENPDDTDWD